MSDLEYMSIKCNTDLNNKLIDLEVKTLAEDCYHFYTLTYEEFVNLMNNKGFLFGYCDHVLRDQGSYIEMLNMALPFGKSYGVAEAKFVRFSLAPFVRRIVSKLVNSHYSKLESDSVYAESNKYGRVEFKFDNARLTKWDKLYSQGSGGVDLEISSECQEKLNEMLAKDKSGTLREQIDRKFQMAKNQTHAFWERGKLALYSSWGSEFTFKCAGMYGGIINHDDDGIGNWSTHT